MTLGEQLGLRGVEVLGNRSTPVVVVVGVAAADPAVDLIAVADGEDEPVAEAVDDPAGRGVAAQAGGDDLGVGGAEVAQVIGQRGPAHGCVAEGEPLVVGKVGAEPVGQVGRCPGVAEVSGEEVGGQLVKRQETIPVDGNFPFVSPVGCGSATGVGVSAFASCRNESLGSGRVVAVQVLMEEFGVVGFDEAGQPVVVGNSV